MSAHHIFQLIKLIILSLLPFPLSMVITLYLALAVTEDFEYGNDEVLTIVMLLSMLLVYLSMIFITKLHLPHGWWLQLPVFISATITTFILLLYRILSYPLSGSALGDFNNVFGPWAIGAYFLLVITTSCVTYATKISVSRKQRLVSR
jgi:hypothetical protein